MRMLLLLGILAPLGSLGEAAAPEAATTQGAAPLNLLASYPSLPVEGTYVQEGTLFALNLVTAGVVIEERALGSPQACAAACRDLQGCSAFNHRACEQQVGEQQLPPKCGVLRQLCGRRRFCSHFGIGFPVALWQAWQLPGVLKVHCRPPQVNCTAGCELLSTNCTLGPQLVPPVVSRNATATAGFPIRSVPLELPGFVTHTALGIVPGVGDFECSGTQVQGACAYPSSVDAAALCAVLRGCLAVVVFSNGACLLRLWVLGSVLSRSLQLGNLSLQPPYRTRHGQAPAHPSGTDGCSPNRLAVLKSVYLSPSNEFKAPNVYTLESAGDADLVRERGAGMLPPPPPHSHCLLSDQSMHEWRACHSRQALNEPVPLPRPPPFLPFRKPSTCTTARRTS